MHWTRMKETLFGRTAHCEEHPLADDLDEVEIIEEEQRTQGSFLPPYRMLLQGVKSITMSLGGTDINGFKLSFGLPLSPNFLVGHEVQMAPPKPKQQGGFDMMELMGGKIPFYTLNVQYHHGEFTERVQKHIFSLVGKIDSNGKLDAIFFKGFSKWNLRLHCAFLNSNMQFSNTSLEAERKDKNSKQTFTFTPQALEYTLMTRLGNKFAFGVEATYMKQVDRIGVGFALRYMRNLKERYYINWSESMQCTVLGSLIKLDNNTSIATELEMAGETYASLASLGYRRKAKNYEVNSAIKSNGEIKSLFTYNNMSMYKLKLFLAGNLYKEDFRSGYSFSFGQADD